MGELTRRELLRYAVAAGAGLILPAGLARAAPTMPAGRAGRRAFTLLYAGSGPLDHAGYLGRLGSVNAAPFLGFGPGEVLFRSCSAIPVAGFTCLREGYEADRPGWNWFMAPDGRRRLLADSAGSLVFPEAEFPPSVRPDMLLCGILPDGEIPWAIAHGEDASAVEWQARHALGTTA